MVNQSFDSALLLTTHGIIIRNPSVKEKIEYLFLSFSEFSEVKIFTIQNSGMPLISLAKDDFSINISTSMVMDIPINQPEEVVSLQYIKSPLLKNLSTQLIIKLN